MQKTLKNILFKSFTILVVLVLVAPSLVKMGHAFEDHKHEVCIDKSSFHFHTLDLECEFYKFNISNPLLLSKFQYEIPYIDFNSSTETIGLYNFDYNHQQLYFSLRAPPHVLI